MVRFLLDGVHARDVVTVTDQSGVALRLGAIIALSHSCENSVSSPLRVRVFSSTTPEPKWIVYLR